MANWVTIRSAGNWPSATNITIRLTDGRDGPPLNGELALFMMKDGDESSKEPIFDTSQAPIVANVQNGQWSCVRWNLQGYKDKGLDTLVTQDDAGRTRKHTFGVRNAAPAGTADNAQPANSNAEHKLEFNLGEPKPVETDGKVTSYEVPAYVSVFRGKKTAEGVDIDFFRQYVKEDASRNDSLPGTDDDGNLTYVFTGISPDAGKIILSARIRGASNQKALSVTIPKPAKKEEKAAAEILVITAANSSNRDGFFAITVQSKKGDKPCKMKFDIVCTENLTVKVGQEPIKEGTAIEMETADNGCLMFLVKFDHPIQAELVFTMNQGFSHSELLCKMPPL